MATMQSVVDRARVPLNDADKVRYSDADLLGYIVHGCLHAFRARPDLFLGTYSTVATINGLALGGTFPLPDEYIQVLADYATARGESHDDEAVSSGRAAMFFELFGREMNG